MKTLKKTTLAALLLLLSAVAANASDYVQIGATTLSATGLFYPQSTNLLAVCSEEHDCQWVARDLQSQSHTVTVTPFGDGAGKFTIKASRPGYTLIQVTNGLDRWAFFITVLP